VEGHEAAAKLLVVKPNKERNQMVIEKIEKVSAKYFHSHD